MRWCRRQDVVFGRHTRWQAVPRIVSSVLLWLLFTGVGLHAASAAMCNLTAGHWLVFGSDAGSGACDGSVMHITVQETAGEDFRLEGYVDWVCANAFGREVFTGTFAANRRLHFAGRELAPPFSNIVLAIYDAEVTEDCGDMVNGTWVPIGGGPRGTWHAVHVVPLGGTVTGGTPRRVVCQNMRTGQKVVMKDGATSWDCEAQGLVVNPGDKFRMVVQGTAD